jgi:hypothetical protein
MLVYEERVIIRRKHHRMQQDLSGRHSTISTKRREGKRAESQTKKEDSPLDGVS